MEFLWILKHAPKLISDCAGNDDAREELRKWAIQWASGKRQKAILLYGPPGVGKTAIARAIALEFGWALVESGASDLRNKETIERLYGMGRESAGLFGSRRLMVFDEVDGAFDRGEVPELSRLLSTAAQPIMLIANDAWNPKLATMRAACKVVEFKSINATTVRKTLAAIAAKEGVSSELVEAISSACRGDLRSGINDLQAGVVSERERKQNPFNVVSRILKSVSYRDAMAAANESEVDFDLLSRWLEENVPAEYEEPAEVYAAFEALSRSSLFHARRHRRQYHALLKYERALAVAGVALAKKEKYMKFTRYAFPSYVKALSAARISRAIRDSAAAKAAQKLECSKKDALSSLAYFSSAPGAAEYFGFTLEEAEFVSAFHSRKASGGRA